MNVFSVSGNVGQDGNLRTAGSTPVLNFSVADTIGFGDKKRTQWISCAIWGKRAEALAPHIKKGTRVTVWGELELKDYEKRDGGKDKNLNLNVSQIAMHGGAQPSQPSQGGFGESDDPAYSASDVPF
mgnify:CR=1 FL=1